MKKRACNDNGKDDDTQVSTNALPVAHVKCTQLHRHIFVLNICEHFYCPLQKYTRKYYEWVLTTDSHLKEKNVRGDKTSLHKILIIGCSSVGPPSDHPTSALRCNEEECHQFWSTAISSQERSPLWLLICQLCNSFLFSVTICILQIYHAPVSNSLFNVHRNICLFSVLLVNFMFDWIGFWMLYPEHDHQDVREVQRVHYGEFVMRLVGSSGQMMSLQ